MMSAKAILAVALLLTLVAGSIAWPAAASGPLCTLSCCAARAPHAAGSCMAGSCETGTSTHDATANGRPASHHHHEVQPAQESDQSSAFSGATASAGGSTMAAVPTIEAAPYEASPTDNAQANTTATASNRSNNAGMSATVLSKPCQYDCGACAAGFAAPKRSRNAAATAGHHHLQPLPSVKLVAVRHAAKHTSSAQLRQSIPRGPPPNFS